MDKAEYVFYKLAQTSIVNKSKSTPSIINQFYDFFNNTSQNVVDGINKTVINPVYNTSRNVVDGINKTVVNPVYNTGKDFYNVISNAGNWLGNKISNIFK